MKLSHKLGKEICNNRTGLISSIYKEILQINMHGKTENKNGQRISGIHWENGQYDKTCNFINNQRNKN